MPACGARAPCSAGCDQSAHHTRRLYRREASLLRRDTVVRRVGCRLVQSQHFASRACERATVLDASREEEQHANLPGAHRATLVVVGRCTMQGHRVGKRPLSSGARPWCDVPAATSCTAGVSRRALSPSSAALVCMAETAAT